MRPTITPATALRAAIPLLTLLTAACTIVDDVNGPPRPGASGFPGATASSAPLPGASAAPRVTPRPTTRPTGGDEDPSNEPGDEPTDEPSEEPTDEPSDEPIVPIGGPVEPDAPMPEGVMLLTGGGDGVDLPAGKTLTVAVYGTEGDGEFTLRTSDYEPDPAHPPREGVSPDKIREGAAKKPPIEPDWRALIREKMASGYRLGPAAPRRLQQAYEEGGTSTFEIDMLADESRDSDVECTLVKATEHAYFYVDASVDPATDAIERMAAAWEGGMRDKVRATFGAEAEDGGDGDPRVCVVFAQLEGVGGYFSGANMLPEEYRDGPGRKVVYINYKYLAGPNADEGFAQSTLAHEFQHMINFTYKGLGNDYKYEESWVDEGLADLAKEIAGYGWNSEEHVIPSRVATYLEGVPFFQLQLEPKNNPDTSGGYGQSYLFQRYLMDRFGAGTPKAIIQQKSPGQAGVEAVLRANGCTFEQVYRDWVVANLGAADLVLADPRFRYRAIDFRNVPSGVEVAVTPQVAAGPTASGNQRPWSVGYHQFHATGAQPWTVTLDAEPGVKAVAIVTD